MAPKTSEFSWPIFRLVCETDACPQTVAFLNAMAQNVDFSKIKAPKWLHDEEHGGFRTPFVFTPTRRQLHIAGEEQ